MTSLRLQRQLLSHNISTLVIINILCAVMWFLPFVIGAGPAVGENIKIAGISLGIIHPLVASIVQFLLWIIIGFITTRILEKQKIIPTYNYFFFYLFLIVGTVTPALQTFGNNTIAFAFLLLAFHSTLSYDIHNNIIYSTFNSYLYLTIATLFNIELILLLPAYWLVLTAVQQISWKGFIASIFAIFTISAIICGVGYLLNVTDEIIQHYNILNFENIFNFTLFKQLQPISWIGIGLCVVWFAFYVFMDYADFSEYNISVRRHFNFYITLFIIMLIIYAMNTAVLINLLPIMALLFAFFITIYYLKHNNLFSEIILITFIILCTAYRIAILLF